MSLMRRNITRSFCSVDTSVTPSSPPGPGNACAYITEAGAHPGADNAGYADYASAVMVQCQR
jgi:hypothetical protein